MFVYPRLPLVLKHPMKEQPGISSKTENANDITRDTHSSIFEGVKPIKQTNKLIYFALDHV